MANTIKWSGIEQWKYGLIARWYVSAYYGNDIDVDGVGYYNPTTNPTGHGGPTRPFASDAKIQQDAMVTTNSVVIYDSAYYVSVGTKIVNRVGDGHVFLKNSAAVAGGMYNIILINGFNITAGTMIDVVSIYSSAGAGRYFKIENCVFIENSGLSAGALATSAVFKNNTIIRCSGAINSVGVNCAMYNNVFIGCNNLQLQLLSTRASGTFIDYNVLIGTINTSVAINSKTTDVTVEDFKANGNYFVKSYSEVDLFGNPSGSGATVTQLQTLFNNYFSPVYIDTWQDLDLSLKPTASNMIKFGGLNGTYIGALPVGHYFSGETLWNNYKDAVSTSNIDYDMLSKGLAITPGQEFGTFRSTRISLGAPYILEPINFFANLVYNSDGTPRQGVSNQRIDTTPDDLPDNTKNQRVVYDFRLQYSETVGGALTPFLNFELNMTPEVDNSGRSNLDAAFVALERKKIKVADFIIELTLRRIIID